MTKSKLLKWVLAIITGLLVLVAIFTITTRFRGEKVKIVIQSDISMEGLLLRPEGQGPHPAIILLHGSGGSHQQYDKLYFRLHANAFIKKGFAVLVYTKRGSGKNEVDYDNFTFTQLLNDARAALAFLRTKKDIDQDNIGLMGLSESGWYSPELAYLDGNIRFVINRVSSPLSYTKTVIHEVRMDALDEGFTEEEISTHIVPLTQKIWQFYIDVARDPSMANGPERNAINELLTSANNDERLSKWFTFSSIAEYDSLRYASRGQRYSYDLMPYLKEIDCPMFYVMGEKDKNMPTAQIVDFLKTFREEQNKKIDIKVYEGASHYLYKYGLEDGPYEGWLYQDGYLELLTTWASEQLTTN